MDKIKLDLNEETWRTVFAGIRDPQTEIRATPLFWPAVEYLEAQLGVCVAEEICDSTEAENKAQIPIDFNQKKQ